MEDMLEEFVDVWMDALQFRKSKRWIATQLGISPSTVERRAHKLRTLGVDLPDLPELYRNVDVKKLNDILKSRSS